MDSLHFEYDEQTPPLSDSLLLSLDVNIHKLLKQINRESHVVTLLFCSIETSRSLNQEHRQINKATDILSWQYDQTDEPRIPGFLPHWGDLAICLEICQQQADQNAHSLEKELLRLIVHGMAHLKGYDHQSESEEKQMLNFEIKLLNSINLQNIYTSSS